MMNSAPSIDDGAAAAEQCAARFAAKASAIASSRTSDMPLSRVKRIAKEHSCFDCNNVAANTPLAIAKMTELFVHDITLRGYASSRSDGRRILQKKDLQEALEADAAYAFLGDIIDETGATVEVLLPASRSDTESEGRTSLYDAPQTTATTPPRPSLKRPHPESPSHSRVTAPDSPCTPSRSTVAAAFPQRDKAGSHSARRTPCSLAPAFASVADTDAAITEDFDLLLDASPSISAENMPQPGPVAPVFTIDQVRQLLYMERMQAESQLMNMLAPALGEQGRVASPSTA